ncbi:uncharacterized protein HMPREF1541_04915 [Cyphellophora europaea CBS 101466]|uniref:Exocyst complex component Sec8 n=1 Tax=Cyphellophora europaea (strain CBS 101466) TaxID=1220924 RepID=W2RVT7_CYPE1|nr:uncharacterized protein HMPREF1541_04915 [Cyphellophora europaea CBS 101466]ETN40636.1 hypothetical protein HMPREF1541_04915 [Cyphellophora europaea CBS 101466]
MSGGNPYAVNGYSGSRSNIANPYAGAGGGGGGYADPYLAGNNQSSASVNSYSSRDTRDPGRERRRSPQPNPYGAEPGPGPGPGPGPPRDGRRGAGYGGLGGPPQPPQASADRYGSYDGPRDRRPSHPQDRPQGYGRPPSRPRDDQEQYNPRRPSQPRDQPRDQLREQPRDQLPDSGRYGTPPLAPQSAERRPPTREGNRGYGESRSRDRGQGLKPPEERYQQPPPIPSATRAAANGYAAPTSATSRYKDYSPSRPTKSMDELMRHIQGNWKTLEGDDCVPVKIALQLMDPSSLGLAEKEPDFAETHVDLQKSLKSVVNEHYADFNSAVGTYHKIQNAIRESQNRVRMLKGGLMSTKGGMLTTKPELRSLAETSGSLDDMVVLVSLIEDLKTVPGKLEERISEKRFLSAVDLLMESLRGLRKSELEEIAALSDMRSYFATQESSLVDILVEELHDHLYLKSPYCADRWKKKQPNGEQVDGVASMSETGNSWDRPVYHFLSNLDTSVVMEEDASKNPEADTFYYIHLILESLNKLGHLEEAVLRLEQRMPVELYRVVEKTNSEVDGRYPSHVRGQLNKDKRTTMTMRVDDGRSQVLSDFLWTLYAKFEAVAEGFRILHEVVSGLAAREGISKPDKLIGSFKELWKLYQMEMRSTLHDYLATDGDRGSRGGLTAATAADVFARQQRDRKKRMFKLSEMDQKALGIKEEEDELDEILKSSVPGLVRRSKNKGVNEVAERGGFDNTSAGHKLLIEPGVFNMTILLTPSLTFLQRLKEVVPQTANIPISTLTSFLDDFLINIFHPQLEEAVTELCTHCLVDIEAFEEDASWSKHSPHPIFKGAVTFMGLIRSFSSMLASIPHDQMFTQLIINQLVTYYDKCFGFYKRIVSRVVSSPTNHNAQTLTLKAAASYAESGEVHDLALQLWNASSSGTYNPELVNEEVQALLKAIKASPVSAYDIISDPKSVQQLSLLYNSMQWLTAALSQLRHVVNTPSSKSQGQNTRRWTLIKSLKPLSTDSPEKLTYLPLTSETVIPFDTTVTSFRNLAQTSLLTLHLDIRCGIMYQFSRILCGPDLPGSMGGGEPGQNVQRVDSAGLPPLSSGAYPFVLGSPPGSASPLVLRLNSDLISFDANITAQLGIKERRFIASGLGRLVDRYMVAGADNVLVMNVNGAERMRVDAMVVQQNLRGMIANVRQTKNGTTAPADMNGLGIVAASGDGNEDDGILTDTHAYYSLFLEGPDEVMKYVSNAKSSGKGVGFSYDELRTLIELCFSEALRGDDREESVKARKRMGDVLLQLGEVMWDS